MENFVKRIKPSEMSQLSIGIEGFISQYNQGNCELVDIRMPFETAIWQLGFGLRIPANELADNLDKLPKDKLIVVACPKSSRSIMAMTYLTVAGFKVKFLSGGLIALVDYLKGGKAKELKL